VPINWALRESARAELQALVKRILRKYGYPPDKQEKATQTVLEQAELINKDWADKTTRWFRLRVLDLSPTGEKLSAAGHTVQGDRDETHDVPLHKVDEGQNDAAG
jgi:hypothetical protein